MDKHIAIYLRVSSKKQDTRSQESDLKRWAETQDVPVKWYRDKFTGKTMDRPAWNKLAEDMKAGHVAKIVVWRLDRLGRTAKGLVSLFDELTARKVGLFSMRDSLDLSTAAGRLMANVLASVAAYENEVRSERILAGQQVARASGKTWGGSKAGVRKVVSEQQEKVIRQLKKDGVSVAEISRTVGLSRPTIYDVLKA